MAQAIGRVRRRWVIVGGLAILGVLLVLGITSGFYVDVLWFREVGQSGVFWRILRTKLALGVVFGTLFFVLLAANLLLARRLRRRFQEFTPDQRFTNGYRALVDPYSNQLIPAWSAVIA